MRSRPARDPASHGVLSRTLDMPDWAREPVERFTRLDGGRSVDRRAFRRTAREKLQTCRVRRLSPPFVRAFSGSAAGPARGRSAAAALDGHLGHGRRCKSWGGAPSHRAVSHRAVSAGRDVADAAVASGHAGGSCGQATSPLLERGRGDACATLAFAAHAACRRRSPRHGRHPVARHRDRRARWTAGAARRGDAAGARSRQHHRPSLPPSGERRCSGIRSDSAAACADARLQAHAGLRPHRVALLQIRPRALEPGPCARAGCNGSRSRGHRGRRGRLPSCRHHRARRSGGRTFARAFALA